LLSDAVYCLYEIIVDVHKNCCLDVHFGIVDVIMIRMISGNVSEEEMEKGKENQVNNFF